jgi:osmoprotectant transport system substrate-binding protein/osmoprotectant transport system permease protein
MMAEQLALLPGRLAAHLELSLAALAIATLVSIPIGIRVARRGAAANAVLAVASVVQTLPSLALLAIMVPLLAGLGTILHGPLAALGLELRGIGKTPALVALTLYGMLPILRNTVTGLAGVDPAVREAARGVGMTPRQQLLRVELPLALPVIVAGVRTAAVWIVGTATLSTPVGATSLGNFIFSGLQTRNTAAVLVGCAAAAGLALVLDQLILLLEVGLRRRRRGTIALACAALLLLGVASAIGPGAAVGVRPVTIGAKTFTEQYVLAEIVALRIRRETGLPVRVLESLGSTVAFDALRTGAIDLYVDYSWTLWATVMKRGDPPRERGRVRDEVARFLREEHGIAVAAALGFENAYALGMRAERARELGISRIAELAEVAPTLEIGGDYEFFQRPEWAALERGYGLAFRAERSMDPALMIEALVQGEVDVLSAFSTDGRLAANDVRLLEDDLGVIPPYDALLLVGPRLQAGVPEAAAALAALDGAIDAPTMQRMNLAVDRDGVSPAEVARRFLDDLEGTGRP